MALVGFPKGKPFVRAPATRTVVVPGFTTAQKRENSTDERRLHYELGKLVRRWSWLHERLVGVFHLASATHKSIAYAIWHSSKSDAAQRDMLVAALTASINELRLLAADKHHEFQRRVFDEYIWIVKEIGKHSHDRNDLIHSPIALFLGSGAVQFEAIVTDAYANPRAVKLANKELFQLCRWLTSFCEDMGTYLSLVDQCVRLDSKLPARPKFKQRSELPTRRQPPAKSARWRKRTTRK